MFNLQGSEIVFILLLALVVLGPEKLPGAIRRMTRLYAELRKMSTGFQTELRSALDEPIREVRETADLLRDAADPNKLLAEEAAAERQIAQTPAPSTAPAAEESVGPDAATAANEQAARAQQDQARLAADAQLAGRSNGADPDPPDAPTGEPADEPAVPAPAAPAQRWSFALDHRTDDDDLDLSDCDLPAGGVPPERAGPADDEPNGASAVPTTADPARSDRDPGARSDAIDDPFADPIDDEPVDEEAHTS